MPEFHYRAIDKSGKSHKGILAAEDESHLEIQLQEIGYWLVDAFRATKKNKPRRIKISRAELIEFCTSMAAMLGAGISITDALNSIKEETHNPGFEHVLDDISINITAGNTFVSAISKYPDIFPTQMCNLINAAEYSGNLVEAFKDVSEYLIWLDKLIKDIKQVSLYPVMVLSIVGCFILLLFSFVVPKFTELLTSVDVALPLITEIVLAISDITKQYWYLFLLIPYVVMKILRVAVKQSTTLAHAIDSIKLKLPIFGEVIHMLSLSRFTHNMAILIRSGVPVLQSLELCRDLVGNRVVSSAIRDAELAVNQGRTMSEVFRTHSVFPPTLLRMIIVGEETGTLEKSLEHISDRYDDEIPRRITKIMGILEPLIMVFLIGIVGSVAMAIFLPLMKLMGSVG